MGYSVDKERLRGWMESGWKEAGLSEAGRVALRDSILRTPWNAGIPAQLHPDAATALDSLSQERRNQLWNMMFLYYRTPSGGQVDSTELAKIGLDVSFLDTDRSDAAWKSAYDSFQWRDKPGAPAPAPKPGPAAAASTPASPATDDILKDIHNEYLRLSGAPGNDPIYQSFLNAGRSAGQTAAGSAGVNSREGLGLRGVAGAAAQATMPYMQQRQALAQSYLGLGNQRDLGLQQLTLGRDQLGLQAEQMRDNMALQAQALKNQVALANWQNQSQVAQGVGSLVGAGVGALGFLGGPAVGAITTPMGASLGAGIGGMAVGAPTLGSYAPRGSYSAPSGGYRGGWS